MGNIFKTKIEKGLFITALAITLFTAFLGYANSSINADWVNRDYEDYQSEPDRYTVTQVPIKEFRTLNGSNDASLSIVDFYRVCIVEVKVAGGQTMKFYVPRGKDDSIGDNVRVAYLKHWDTEYDRVMKSSDVEPDSILHTARADEVTDGLYGRIFTLIAIVSAIFTAVVFFICYKKKDAYVF